MMARPKKVSAPVETPVAETEKVEQSEQAPVETPVAGKLRYRVTNSRIGHDVGKILEYDKEPHILFLRCLEPVE